MVRPKRQDVSDAGMGTEAGDASTVNATLRSKNMTIQFECPLLQLDNNSKGQSSVL